MDDATRAKLRDFALAGAAAVCVLAIAIAVPLAVRDEPGQGGRPAPFATEDAPTPTPTVPSPSPLQESRLGWPLRGASAVGEVTDRANRAWTADHPATESYHPLYSSILPDGRRIEVLEAVEAARSFAVFYVEDADGSNGRIVQGLEVVDRNPQGPAQGKQSQTRLPQVSAYIDGPQDFVLIVGAPTTGQLEFSTDGRRYTSVETFEGVEVIAVTKGDDRTAYRIRVYDGDGVVVYDGPIDLLSED